MNPGNIAEGKWKTINSLWPVDGLVTVDRQKSDKLIDYRAVSLLLTLKKPPPQTVRSTKTSLVWQEKESSHQ